MKKFLKVVKLILLIIVIGIFGFNLYSAYGYKLTKNNSNNLFGFGSGVIISGSMEPTINYCDFIIFKQQASYQVGDIVVFTEDDMLVSHRIVNIEGDVITTKGDNNDSNDSPINLVNVKGKVVCVIGKIGYVVRWMQTPLGLLTTLAFAFALIILSDLLDNKSKNNLPNEQQKEKEELERQIAELKNKVNKN